MTTLPAIKTSPGTAGIAATGPIFVSGGGTGGASPGGKEASSAHLAATIGIGLALASIAMFFLALTSAFVVRHGLGENWGGFPVPGLLWVNTAVLAFSSVSAETARRRSAAGWLGVTLALGLMFLGGQALAWTQLSASGFGVGTTPYSSFVWLFTGAHAVHLCGGLIALAAAAGLPLAAARRARWIHVAAIYWHFMGILWLGLFGLLVFWR